MAGRALLAVAIAASFRLHDAAEFAACVDDCLDSVAFLQTAANLQGDPDSTTSSATQRRKPNIALIVLDQWRWDYAGFDAPGMDMPTIRRLAARGTRFTRAYAPAPQCKPSRSAFAAGMEYKNMWVKNNLDDYLSVNSTPTYMSLLKEAGYTTIMAGKDDLSSRYDDGAVDASALGLDMIISADKYSFCDQRHGLNPYDASLLNMSLLGQQCQVYGQEGKGNSCNKTQVCSSPPPSHECGFHCPVTNPIDESINIDQWAERQAEVLLTEHWALDGKTSPWYLELNFPSPHPPFILSPSMAARTAGKSFPPPIDANFEGVTDNPMAENVDLLQTQREYAGLLEMLDDQIGKFLAFLRRHNVDEDTVVIVTSDHGEHLGDHTEFAKSSAWEQSSHVPLIVSGRSVRSQVVEQPVATLDMVATMLELAGTEPLPGMDTRTLLPVLTTEHSKVHREVILSGISTGRGFDGRKGDFESAGKLFNGTAYLRLVCCLTGCIKQGSMLRVTSGAQVALMHVTPGAGAGKYEHNVLNEPPGYGVPEAEMLMHHLSEHYRQACSPLLRPTVNNKTKEI